MRDTTYDLILEQMQNIRRAQSEKALGIRSVHSDDSQFEDCTSDELSS